MATAMFAAYRAFYGIVDAALASSLTVFDGPAVTSGPPRDFIAVGVPDLTSEALALSVEGTSDWLDLGALHREETFTIHSMLAAWDGSTNLAQMRDRAEANVNLLDAALRTPAGVTLHDNLGSPGWCGLQVGGFLQAETERGGAVHVPLRLYCTAHI